MKLTLSDIINPEIVALFPSTEMLVFTILIVISAVIVVVVTGADVFANRIRYIKPKSFLKMEDRGGVDLSKWDKKIAITHKYHEDNFIFMEDKNGKDKILQKNN